MNKKIEEMAFLRRVAVVFVLLLFWVGPAIAQTCATTETGRRVVLLEDSSWRFARGNECESENETDSGTTKTTEVVIGSESYQAGVRKTIIDANSFARSFDIKAQIVDKNGQPILVLWRESDGSCSLHYFGDPNTPFKHNSRIFLSGGEVIRFIDRGNKGSRTIRNARTETNTRTNFEGELEEVEETIDVCQEWIAYRITESEINDIKRSEISKIEIETGMDASAELFRVDENRNTLSDQAKSLGF